MTKIDLFLNTIRIADKTTTKISFRMFFYESDKTLIAVRNGNESLCSGIYLGITIFHADKTLCREIELTRRLHKALENYGIKNVRLSELAAHEIAKIKKSL